jgi:hypothetical protein
VAQLYQMTFTATGEVRDADGNLVENVPIETTRVVTAEEAAEILGHSEGEPS